jgi:hypothetical protein
MRTIGRLTRREISGLRAAAVKATTAAKAKRLTRELLEQTTVLFDGEHGQSRTVAGQPGGHSEQALRQGSHT